MCPVKGAPQRLLRLGEQGFTLTELIVVMSLLGVLLAAIYNIFGAGQSYYATIEGQNQAVQYASRSEYQMATEAREAMDIITSVPGYGAVTPGPYQMAIRSDLDNDSSIENIAYVVDNSQQLVKYVNEPNSVTATSRVVAKYVRNKVDSIPLFTYYDSTGTAVSDASEIPGKTHSIRINVTIDTQPGVSPPALNLITTVQRRNLPSG